MAADFVAKSYVSTGNVLVVEVDIKYNSIQFEEYDLANFIPQESTGEITFSNFFVQNEKFISFQLSNYSDTLLLFSAPEEGYRTQLSPNSWIPSDTLTNLPIGIPYDSTFTNNLFAINESLKMEVWNRVSRFDLIQNYRSEHPNSKVTFLRQVVSFDDPNLSLSIPVEKIYLFLTK